MGVEVEWMDVSEFEGGVEEDDDVEIKKEYLEEIFYLHEK